MLACFQTRPKKKITSNFICSKDGESATILPLNASAAIGQRVMLSALDCLKLNHLYGCLAGHHTAMYTAFCQQLALWFYNLRERKLYLENLK